MAFAEHVEQVDPVLLRHAPRTAEGFAKALSAKKLGRCYGGFHRTPFDPDQHFLTRQRGGPGLTERSDSSAGTNFDPPKANNR
ncbi:MAG: hypothetical protein KF797_01320 [Flavobacteriales bacterium]|nr:hypothetical protein [Flavobacteriales bacterium]